NQKTLRFVKVIREIFSLRVNRNFRIFKFIVTHYPFVPTTHAHASKKASQSDRYNAVLVSLYFCNNCLPSALLLTSIYNNYNN
uniref:Uncharacterized protein n=1 Tax=Glossina palpalis gambiensis TaxID=67801 RepID=A0A1B0B5A6_9MUSC